MRVENKWPLLFSLGLILGSALLTTTLVYQGVKWRRNKQAQALVSITHIMQTGPEKELLTTDQLAEALDLSADKVKSASSLDLSTLHDKLLVHPLIKTAYLKFTAVDTLFIDYTMRQPLVRLIDYDNVALDSEGVPIPLDPYFSPKNLCEACLGINQDIEWGEPLTGKKVHLFFNVYKLLSQFAKDEQFHIKRIDVSHAFDTSYGSRELVVILENHKLLTADEEEVLVRFPHFLRLSPESYPKGLGNYLNLKNEMMQSHHYFKTEYITRGQMVMSAKTIDLRLPNMALIDMEDESEGK